MLKDKLWTKLSTKRAEKILKMKKKMSNVRRNLCKASHSNQHTMKNGEADRAKILAYSV